MVISNLRTGLSSVYHLCRSDARTLRCGSLKYFKGHVMDPNFEYGKYLKVINPFFAQFGFRFPNVEAEYYSLVSGIKADHYIPTTFFYNLLCPYLNKYQFRLAYQDKNMLDKYLRHEGTGGFRLADIVIKNINGIYYDGADNHISKDVAVNMILDYPGNLIAKPAVDTTWGAGVTLVSAQDKTRKRVLEIMEKEGTNYNFQEKIVQHPLLASFNESSLNTVRIYTYRHIDNTIRVLGAMQRFGGKNSIVDNASAGGGFVSLTMDGTIKDRRIKRYRAIDTGLQLTDNVTTYIPQFDKLKAVTVRLHEKLPYFNCIGWDMTVDEQDCPCVIEFNTMMASEFFQLANGPMLTSKELHELIPLVMEYQTCKHVQSNVSFPNKSGFGIVEGQLIR